MRTQGKAHLNEINMKDVGVYDEDNKLIAVAHGVDDIANADFIVKVWNSHDELVEALESVAKDIEVKYDNISDETFNKIRTALNNRK